MEANNKAVKKLNALIVSHPGTWRNMLQKTIEAYSFVTVIKVVCGSLSAVQLAKDHNPDLMVIDSSIPFDELIALIENIKREYPEIRTIVIVDTTQQQHKITQVGADFTIASFRFEDQIGEILDLLKESILDKNTSPPTNQKTNPTD